MASWFLLPPGHGAGPLARRRTAVLEYPRAVEYFDFERNPVFRPSSQDRGPSTSEGPRMSHIFVKMNRKNEKKSARPVKALERTQCQAMATVNCISMYTVVSLLYG